VGGVGVIDILMGAEVMILREKYDNVLNEL
jgi:hypothetical protein